TRRPFALERGGDQDGGPYRLPVSGQVEPVLAYDGRYTRQMQSGKPRSGGKRPAARHLPLPRGVKSYLEVRVASTEGERELILPVMIMHGFRNFEETDDAIAGTIDQTGWNERRLEEFKTGLERDLTPLGLPTLPAYRELPERNWNEAWESSIQPVEIGPNLVIRPSWGSYRNAGNRLEIRIDPKMSFGTGHHESTRLILRLLQEQIKPGVEALDIGTGSGILAIAAAKLGAKRAEAIDIDEWSITNARENVAANLVQDRVAVSDSPLSEVRTGPF